MTNQIPTEDEIEYLLGEANNFQKDFRDLVRKYVPNYPTQQVGLTEAVQRQNFLASYLLRLMQDKTSVYNPFIWSK